MFKHPLCTFSGVNPDLEFAVDGCDGAAAALHSIGDLREREITVTQQFQNPVQLIRGKISALGSDHFGGLLPALLKR
jgi:hypothetical protein